MSPPHGHSSGTANKPLGVSRPHESPPKKLQSAKARLIISADPRDHCRHRHSPSHFGTEHRPINGANARPPPDSGSAWRGIVIEAILSFSQVCDQGTGSSPRRGTTTGLSIWRNSPSTSSWAAHSPARLDRTPPVLGPALIGVRPMAGNQLSMDRPH